MPTQRLQVTGRNSVNFRIVPDHYFCPISFPSRILVFSVKGAVSARDAETFRPVVSEVNIPSDSNASKKSSFAIAKIRMTVPASPSHFICRAMALIFQYKFSIVQLWA